MISLLYISLHHMEIGFIDFIVINFNEVGSHRELIFLNRCVFFWPEDGPILAETYCLVYIDWLYTLPRQGFLCLTVIKE
jgi:hypothetical protein